MTLKIIRHSQHLIDITRNLSYCYRSHSEQHVNGELLNIEFYDYFIICLFLFYDRFYRSLAFYVGLCFTGSSLVIFTLARLGTFRLLLFLFLVYVPRVYFFFSGKLKNLSHTLFSSTSEDQKPRRKKEKNLCEMRTV